MCWQCGILGILWLIRATITATWFGPLMKIVRVETHVCHARMRNWIFVKVITDQDGLFGWGEATLEWHTRAVVGAIEDSPQLSSAKTRPASNISGR